MVVTIARETSVMGGAVRNAKVQGSLMKALVRCQEACERQASGHFVHLT